MSTRTAERVDEWETVPFSGGYAGLHDLSDESFSGVVQSGMARLFMLNGTPVGILDGEVSDFENADATAREAPHEALPLLAVMQKRSEEVRAQYYTEDTPIEEVDGTLSSGGFTGYLELSENVLSGDYYLVYHQGRSMSVAFVGESSRLLTDEEAFERANDEVGIYEVRPVDIDVVEIPEPEDEVDRTDDATAAGDATTATSGDTGPADDDASAARESSSDERRGEADDAGQPVETGARSDTPAADAAEEGTATGGGAGSAERTGAADRRGVGGRSETDRRTADAGGSTTDAVPQRSGSSGAGDDRDGSGGSASRRHGGGSARTGGRDAQVDSRGQSVAEGNASSSEAAARPGQLETRSIPSMDPSRTASATPAATSSSANARGTALDATQAGAGGHGRDGASDGATGGSRSGAGTEPDPHRESAGPAREADHGDEALRAARQEVERLEDDLSALRAERDDLRTERDDLRAQIERLESELESARERQEQLEERLAEFDAEAAADAERQLGAREAIDATNLFVRYHSKGDATLEKAHGGSVNREAVAENLRLEYHTQFDAESAAVGSEPFDEFFRDTIQYRFVDWLVQDLLFEIRDTGHESGMRELYDALPRIDRAELNGQVTVTYTENGEEHRTQEGFDVVVRDRMGNPLAVANLNDSRDPARERMMTELVTSTERLGKANESLAGAFLVTSSFFEPEALETAEEATSGGLFSRDKRRSFVNLSRKDGYHLCLVEARKGDFHLAVPEL